MGDAYVHPSAEVSPEASIGYGTRIWHYAHVREGAKIGENCIIGKDVYIDHEVMIGNNVKIQNGVSVYYGVTVEDDVILAPNATVTNDLYPRAFSENWQVIPTLIKRGASVGANATIVCGVTLGEYCMVAAGTVVTKSVPAHGLVMGNPGRLRGFVCKCGLTLGCREPNSSIIDGDRVELICKECEEITSVNLDLYRLVFKDVEGLEIGTFM
jgi:UDP-2-acetamido-3-amino-2,3-dideoxy-glucuronate N-acetyltransferase